MRFYSFMTLSLIGLLHLGLTAQLDVRVQQVPVQNEQRPTASTERQNIEQTLSILKPDAVRNGNIGNVLSRFEKAGLRIAAIKMVRLSKENAGRFYAVHRDRPFYNDLTNFMASGPIVAVVLEGPNAIAKNRELMGATDPKKAAQGTIRADYAQSTSENAVHGSDSSSAAREEISFFFADDEIQSNKH